MTKPIVKLPPPPPPNPRYQTRQDSPTTAERQPAAASVALSTVATNDLYDVRTEGPLTYFDYYFEEMKTATSESPSHPLVKYEELTKAASAPPAPPPAKSSRVSVGMMGAGLAATAVSGLVIGDALKQSETPKPTKPVNAVTQQNSTQTLRRSADVAPERQAPERSQLNNTPTPASDRSNPPAKPTPTLDQTEALLASLDRPISPATPGSTVSSAPLTPNLSPVSPPRAKSAWSTTQFSKVRVSTAPQRSVLAAAARPERLPDLSSQTPLPPLAANSNPVSVAVSPAAESGAIAPPAELPQIDTLQPSNPNGLERSGNPVTMTNQPSNLVANQSASAEMSGLQRLFPPHSTPVKTNRAIAFAPPVDEPPAVDAAAVAPGNPSGLQDYINLPKTLPPTRTMTLMPLSQQAANEAGSTRQVGQFTVRQVNIQDYQKEWMASNPTRDSADATAFPAYGFIDYQRQLIVVLQEQPTPATLQSQTLPTTTTARQ
ncbi:MAG: hypothetical protein NW220_05940 [Leptolyngbyaceae cyanobacterium bins.349]|nr:hypothetical protein [Leptolyngbyaceae cyanobacterium bins.349]